jgi:hypothetical protein
VSEPVGELPAWVFYPPQLDHGRLSGNPAAHDEPISGVFKRAQILLRKHPSISHHGHLGKPVSGPESVQNGHYRVGFGFVPLETTRQQREPCRVSQQADRDLRFQTPLFRVARLA